MNDNKYINLSIKSLYLLLERPDVGKVLITNYILRQKLTIRKLLPLTKYKTIAGLFRYLTKLKKSKFIIDNDINNLNVTCRVNNRIWKR